MKKQLHSLLFSPAFLLALLVCNLAALPSLAQSSPPIHWQKSLGGSGNDFANSIHQTTDGGVVMAGYSYSNDGDASGNHGNSDYWIVKLDSIGTLEWQKSLGGTDWDQASSIQQSTDGGFVVAGSSLSNDGDVSESHGGYDCWVVKLNSTGTLEWQKSLGGSANDLARSIQQTNDGGFVVAGSSNSNDGDVLGNHGSSDCWIVKLDSTGILEWQKSLGGTSTEDTYSIQQTADEGFVMAGYSYSNDGDASENKGGSDYWIVKLDYTGGLEWQESLGGTYYDYATSIQQTIDGGFVVAGYSSSNDGDVSGNHGSSDYWIVKLNSTGILEWQKSLGGTSLDYAKSFQQTSDGGLVVAGWSQSYNGDVSGNHGNGDCWIVKLNATGAMEWQKSLGGTSSDYAESIQQASDGGLVVAGWSYSNNGDVSGNHGGSDGWIVKLYSCNSMVTFYADEDGDGYGDEAMTIAAPACSPPSGYLFNSTDCNDANAAINPGKIEVCNNLDDDCNGSLDEGVQNNYYHDADQDGYGSDEVAIQACSAPAGYVANTTDCDDANGAIHPLPAALIWQKSLGGAKNDFSYSVKQTTDGGFVVVGSAESNDGEVSGNHGSIDCWIVKLNSTGALEWQKSLGGSSYDGAQSIQQTTDGGFVVAGYSYSNDGDVSGHHGSSFYSDYWVVKLNSAGAIEWQKSLGGTSGDNATSIQQTTDGGFVVAGESSSNDGDVSGNHGYTDYWIVKLDLTGTIEWQKSLGGANYDRAFAIQQTTDGGFVVAGESSSNDGDVSGNHGSSDYWIVKLNSTGIMEWQKSLGGTAFDMARSIQQTSDGGFLVAGESNSIDGDVSGNHGLYDYWIVKLNASGTIEWQKPLGGTLSEYARSIHQTTDGGFAVAGGSYSSDGDVSGHHGSTSYTDFWVVKLDFTGDIEWQSPLGGSTNDYAQTIQQTTDGGFVVAGNSFSNESDVSGHHGTSSYSDYWIVKLANSSGGIEVCNNLDDDCNGVIDDGFITTTYYADADGDNYGDANNSLSSCATLSGYVTDSSDCDDNNAAINPAAFPTKQWDFRYGGSGEDQSTSLVNTADGGYIISGLSKSPISFEKSEANRDASNATNDYWLLKTDESGVKQWDKTIGGTGEEASVRVIQLSDGSYLLAGSSSSGIGGDKTQASKGLTDYWMVKVSSTGAVLWDKDFGGTGDDLLREVIKTSDGGFLLGGESNSPTSGDKSQASQGLKDYWIVKTDASGNKLWDQRFGGTKDEILAEILETSDGGFLLAGRSFSGNTGNKTQSNWDASLLTPDYWIVKTDGSGNYQWDKRYGGTAEESLFAIASTSDNGYLLGGYSKSSINGDKTMNSQGASDYWVVKIDAAGSKIYDAQYGGSNEDQASLLQSTFDNGFIISGFSLSAISGDKSQSSQGLRDYWLVKADANGVKQWDVRYGGSKNDAPTALQLSPDGGLIVSGSSSSGLTGDKTQDNHDATLATRDYWLVKLSVNNGYQSYYVDADGDNYGDAQQPFVLACTEPSGYRSDHNDCNDANANVNPGASDVCNSLDDNCNGVVDENAITATVTPSGTVNVCSGAVATLTANSSLGISYQWKKGNTNIIGATNSVYTTGTAGSYKVQESNSYSCSSTSASTTVTVVALPNATITPQGDLDICLTGSVDLKANSGTGYTYQWKKGNSNIAGATNKLYTATTAATYKVTVTNSTGCSKTSGGTKVIKSCKQDGVIDEGINPKLSLYPNPTNGTFVIELQTGDDVTGEAKIEVLGLLGQVMISERTTLSKGVLQWEIQLSDAVEQGMYLVKVTINDSVFTAQFDLQK